MCVWGWKWSGHGVSNDSWPTLRTNPTIYTCHPNHSEHTHTHTHTHCTTNNDTYHRIRRFVAATRFPAATAEKSIWYTGNCKANGRDDMLYLFGSHQNIKCRGMYKCPTWWDPSKASWLYGCYHQLLPRVCIYNLNNQNGFEWRWICVCARCSGGFIQRTWSPIILW